MHEQNPKPRRLLAVFAHPDDETFGPGGTLALYARRGVEVYLVCATRGELGEAPDDLRGYASKAEMRVAELQCASEVLGLKDVFFLDYRDSGMPGADDNRHPRATVAQPIADVAQRIARYIRELQPQVVITFDPIGGYRHPDHIAVQRATLEAFALAGDASVALDGLAPHTPQKLYFHTFPRGMLRGAVRVLRLLRRDPRHFGENGDVDLVSLAEVEFPIHAKIATRSMLRVKQRAMRCHVSQSGSIPAGLLGVLLGIFTSTDHYMRAIPAEPPPHTEKDLFEGVA